MRYLAFLTPQGYNHYEVDTDPNLSWSLVAQQHGAPADAVVVYVSPYYSTPIAQVVPDDTQHPYSLCQNVVVAGSNRIVSLELALNPDDDGGGYFADKAAAALQAVENGVIIGLTPPYRKKTGVIPRPPLLTQASPKPRSSIDQIAQARAEIVRSQQAAIKKKKQEQEQEAGVVVTPSVVVVEAITE